MHKEQIQTLRVHCAGGSDRNGGGTGPAIVLLHGYGAPGDDLVPLWRQLQVPSEARFFFPEAPLTLDLGLPMHQGRAWWPIDMVALQMALAQGRLDVLEQVRPPGLDEAREHLAKFLTALSERFQIPEGRLILGGFSQGAMLACDYALRSEQPLGALVLLSSTLICRDDWSALAVRRAGLKIFQTHGRSDPILPFAQAERLRALLEGGGADVAFYPFNGGHGIPPGALDALGAFLTQVLEP